MVVQTTSLQEAAIPRGYWQREASHYPRPLRPLDADLVMESINQAFGKVFAAFGRPLERFEFQEIGGYVYQATKPYGVRQSGGESNSGGVLSHPAMIAREYGIPAVVATGNATDIVRDGSRVTVDGDTGLVRITG